MMHRAIVKLDGAADSCRRNQVDARLIDKQATTFTNRPIDLETGLWYWKLLS